ncbi:MAG: M48 family metalloprotease [bacterium]|nr:M48 family metalloprotease [bacterium]
MASVYNEISGNKIRTFLIMFLFIGIITAFFYIIGLFFGSPTTYFAVGMGFSLFSSVGSYFFSDKIVLMTTGAKPATKKDFFDFYTVTENLSMASGTPMPKLYVVDDPAPNAFATGRDPQHAVVAATTGLLSMMNRSELEGVIAHELSHIKNYDILLSSVVAVLVGTIALVADWVMRSMWWGGGDNEDRGKRNPIMFVILIVSLILAPIAATLIQLAISRRREFLADASGALTTRYPEGLARALGKIAAYPYTMRSATSATEHLFIENPFKKKGKKESWLMSLFSTHPPVDERIRILRSM